MCGVINLFSLQDMSHVMGKNREELLAMARGYSSRSSLLVFIRENFANGPCGFTILQVWSPRFWKMQT